MEVVVMEMVIIFWIELDNTIDVYVLRYWILSLFVEEGF